MIAMDPAVPSPPSTGWVVFILSVLLLAVIAIFAVNWRRTKPPVQPAPVDPWQAINDAFNAHAVEAAELTLPIPDLDPWLPRDDDIVRLAIKPWAELPPNYRIAFDRIAERLLRDPDFADLIHHIEECQ